MGCAKKVAVNLTVVLYPERAKMRREAGKETGRYQEDSKNALYPLASSREAISTSRFEGFTLNIQPFP